MPLAPPGAPYVDKGGQVTLANGTQDAISSGRITIGAPVARAHIAKKRRSFKDLPAEPKTQTAISVVLMYSLLGLTDNEIAHQINVGLDDVHKLKQLDAYQETFELLFFELISANSNSLQSKIAALAPDALESLAHVMANGKQELARVRAADSILDRAGMNAEQLFDAKSDSGFDGLKIVIQEGEDNKTNIEVNVGKSNGHRER